MDDSLRAALLDIARTAAAHDFTFMEEIEGMEPLIDAAIEGHRAQAHGTGYVQGERRGREAALLAAADDLEHEHPMRLRNAGFAARWLRTRANERTAP